MISGERFYYETVNNEFRIGHEFGDKLIIDPKNNKFIYLPPINTQINCSSIADAFKMIIKNTAAGNEFDDKGWELLEKIWTNIIEYVLLFL